MDQEARDRADEAMNRVAQHEVLCAERWKNSAATLARIEASLKWSIGLAPASAIAGLLSACTFLAERAFHI